MAEIRFKGEKINTVGELPSVGSKGIPFLLTDNQLREVTHGDFPYERLVLNIFPSLDTGVCASSVHHFNKIATEMPHTQVLAISCDLPFAQQRFCASGNIDKVVTLSAFRHPEFGREYGVTIVSGPLEGLLARAIVVLNERFEVIYTELVPEITQEPDYEAVVKRLNR